MCTAVQDSTVHTYPIVSRKHKWWLASLPPSVHILPLHMPPNHLQKWHTDSWLRTSQPIHESCIPDFAQYIPGFVNSVYTKQSMVYTACGLVGWQSRKEHVPSTPVQLAHFTKGCAVRQQQCSIHPLCFQFPIWYACAVLSCVLSRTHKEVCDLSSDTQNMFGACRKGQMAKSCNARVVKYELFSVCRGSTVSMLHVKSKESGS